MRRCKNCSFQGEPKKPGSGYIEVALWLTMLWPVAVVYSIWRRQGTQINVCPSCNNPHMVPCNDRATYG